MKTVTNILRLFQGNKDNQIVFSFPETEQQANKANLEAAIAMGLI